MEDATDLGVELEGRLGVFDTNHRVVELPAVSTRVSVLHAGHAP